jgi:hypothetical protein
VLCRDRVCDPLFVVHVGSPARQRGVHVMGRRHGCERPFHPTQVAVWVIESALYVACVFSIVPELEGAWQVPSIVVG